MKLNVITTGEHTTTSTGRKSALRLSAVSKVYYGADEEDDVLALSDVSLDVAVGEFVVLLGPSGCGKSTLLQLIASLEGLTNGTIEFCDRSGPSQLQTCIVFQEFALFPWRSVVDNVGMARELRGGAKKERREHAKHWIDLVGLRGFEDKYPHQLSGGMRQRVALARALASEPMVLLMDEPFGALDAQTRTKLQTELLRIWESTRKTVLFVTHSVEEAILLGDRIVVMGPRPGRIVEQVVVDIPRPRSLGDRHTTEFQELEERLWISLNHM